MNKPPKLPLRFFRWYCHPKLLDHIEGDLIEVYQQRLQKNGKRKADLKFVRDVLLLFRPSIIKPMEGYKNLNNYGMIKNYFTIALRNIRHNNVFSTINILGLAVGMASVILIGTWINDELSFNNYHRNYNSIAQVMCHSVVNGDINTRGSLSIPLGEELKSKYLDEFKYIVMALPNAEHVLNFEDNRYQINGCFMEPDAPEMLSLEMTKGSLKGLINPSSILLSESASKILFNDVEPINKTLQIDDKMTVAVTGVYRDLPYNSRFKDLMFIAPWALHLSHDDWAKKAQNNWGINSFEIFVQLTQGSEIASTSAKIKDAIRNNIDPKLAETRRPEVFLHPMAQWHLYSEWEHGVNTRSRIQFIWLFGIIGLFILILACINFMNLLIV